MSDEATEKKHAPSAKRLTDLRKQGQTMRSRDLTGGVVFISGILTLSLMSGQFSHFMERNFINAFSQFKAVTQDPAFMYLYAAKVARETLLLLMPIFACVFIATFMSPIIFGGMNFSLSTISFNWGKLNPLNWVKNTFSIKIFFEIARAMMKTGFIMLVLVYFTLGKAREITNLMHIPSRPGIMISMQVTGQFITLLAVVLLFLIAFDMLYHYYEFQKRNKMTDEEVKDEYKDSEGSPEMKRKMRTAQFALVRQRLSQTVPTANVVVTNPSHYAVALRYDTDKDKAPKVVAKGKDHIAAQIRNLAIANGIPLYQAPPLARAMYHTSSIGSEIHPGLYMAVALVLSYVMQLKNYQQTGKDMPILAEDLQIPEDLIYND